MGCVMTVRGMHRIADFGRGAALASFVATLTLALACGSASTDGKPSDSGAGTPGQSVSNGGQAFGGGGSNSGGGGARFAVAGSAGAAGTSAPSGGAGAGGAAVDARSCPNLQTPPTDCPVKVFPDNVVIKTQAAADALAGYTEIDGALTITQDGTSDLLNVEALHCLQKVHFELSVSHINSLTSLDGLAELSEVGAWLTVDHTANLKLGCGLRKLSKIGARGTPYVEFQDNDQLDRIDLSLLGAGVGHFRVAGNAKLQSVVGSPAIVTLGQFFIRDNPVLTSISGFDGLMTASEVRLDTNPMLPVCQVSKIVAELSAPPAIVEINGNLGNSCP